MSQCPYGHQDLVQANNAIKVAQLSLQALIKGVYPVGVTVTANLGGHLVHLEITGHNGAYWAGAGDLHGVNLKTGKTRKFHFSQIVTV
jgi:hypothetical protein